MTVSHLRKRIFIDLYPIIRPPRMRRLFVEEESLFWEPLPNNYVSMMLSSTSQIIPVLIISGHRISQYELIIIYRRYILSIIVNKLCSHFYRDLRLRKPLGRPLIR